MPSLTQRSRLDGSKRGLMRILYGNDGDGLCGRQFRTCAVSPPG